MAQKNVVGHRSSGSDPTPVRQTAEHDLDGVTAPVLTFIVFDKAHWGDFWPLMHVAFVLQIILKPVNILATVGEQPLRFG